MADRAKKITELSAASTVAANDQLVVCQNTATNAVTRSATVAVFMGNIAANVVLTNTAIFSANTIINRNSSTPANATITVTKGTMWYDNSYIYVAIADNTVKRVAISTF